MVTRQPELFSAFVGTGQQVNMRRNEEHNYRWAYNRAAHVGDGEALEGLQLLGPPPYNDFGSLLTLREWTDRLTDGDGDPLRPSPGPVSPDFTAEDVSSMKQGADFSRQQLLAELNGIDLPSLITDFDIPMFFFQGTHDHYTPLDLAEEYFSVIAAPNKEFVRFEGCHHFVVMNKSDDFLRELVTRVRPLL
jgi:pimeloyl-ACP methyl ester carboxylesterase